MLKLFMMGVLFVSTGVFSVEALATPRALIYRGPGACNEGCSEAFVTIARQAGFDPVFVGPNENVAGLFDNAAVWIQPGGYAGTAMQNMSAELKTAIKTFVRNGGGYVGFCAGAFTATAKVGTTSINGLNIFPGGTKLFGKGIDMKRVTWNGSSRHIYWEGGPYLRNLPSSVEVIATYSTGAVAAARTAYGNGRVFVTGLHPEAPASWVSSEDMTDIDGQDWDLVADMLHWASRR